MKQFSNYFEAFLKDKFGALEPKVLDSTKFFLNELQFPKIKAVRMTNENNREVQFMDDSSVFLFYNPLERQVVFKNVAFDPENMEPQLLTIFWKPERCIFLTRLNGMLKVDSILPRAHSLQTTFYNQEKTDILFKHSLNLVESIVRFGSLEHPSIEFFKKNSTSHFINDINWYDKPVYPDHIVTTKYHIHALYSLSYDIYFQNNEEKMHVIYEDSKGDFEELLKRHSGFSLDLYNAPQLSLKKKDFTA